MRNRLKGCAVKLLLFGVSSLLCLGVLEVAVRWLFPYYNPKTQIGFRRTADGLVLGVPGATRTVRSPKGDYELTVKFNRYGFRDEKDLAQSSANDVFVVGDSFSFGWGVEIHERYSDVLASRMGANVYNIAIPGDLLDYFKLVKHAEQNGAKIGRLVIGVCMENDIRNYVEMKRESVTGRPAETDDLSVRDWIKMHFALYNAASHILQAKLHAGALLEKVGIARDIEQTTVTHQFSEPAVVSSRDEVLRLARDYQIVVLIIPSRALWHGKNVESERKIHERFVQLLGEAGLQVVDMRPVFEASGNPLDFYFKKDSHWTPKAHAAAGEALARAFGAK